MASAGAHLALPVSLGLCLLASAGTAAGPAALAAAYPALSWTVYGVLTALGLARILVLVHAAVHGRRGRRLIEQAEPPLIVNSWLFLSLHLSGGPVSALYPALFLSIAFFATIGPVRVAAVAVGHALLLETVSAVHVYRFDPEPVIARMTFSHAVSHALFIVFFAFLFVLLRRLHAEFHHVQGRAKVETILRGIESEAAGFRERLAGPRSDAERFSDTDHDLAAHFEIHAALRELFSLVRDALGLHTIVFYWHSHGELTPIEFITGSEQFRNEPFGAGVGIVGGVCRGRSALALNTVTPDRLTHIYRRDEQITNLLALPVAGDEQTGTLGVLYADRTDRQIFRPEETEALKRTGGLVSRTLVNEQIFRALDRSRSEQKSFFQASKALFSTLNEEDIFLVALESVRSIAPCDFAFITAFDRYTGRHTVMAVRGHGSEKWLSREFSAEGGLIEWVTVHRKPIRHNNLDALPKRPYVVRAGERLRFLRSVLILPLVRHEGIGGVLLIGSGRPDFFTPENENMLEVVANQVSASLENATLYRTMKDMAVTDGLTGLYNHRFFQERLDELVARAQRGGGQLSLALLDIDHFKKVNDTWGHTTGDEILRGLAALLKRSVRKVDLVARYGGEEFVVVLDGTGGEEAAEKIDSLREEVSHLRFQSGGQRFSITASFGLASFPSDGTHKQELIERADLALYHSKKTGRNRVTRWRLMERMPDAAE